MSRWPGISLCAQDNSGTRTEAVGYTDQGFDGYGLMPAYLGREGWRLTTALKAGDDHGQSGFGFVRDRVLPPARGRVRDRPAN